MQKRNTVQRDMVVHAVQSLKCHATADEVYAYIIKDYPSIGKGTVYRNLSILSDEGRVRRVEIPDGPDRFDHTLYEHYHVRCAKCGRVEDVDMEALPNLLDKIGDRHGFQFLDYDILFTGICEDCQSKDEE